MNNLYDYLLSEELKKAELEACRLRFLILGVLAAGFALNRTFFPAAVILSATVLNLFYTLKTGRGGRRMSSGVLIFMETALVTLGFFLIRGVNISGALTFLYLLILYSASLRLKDGLILFAGVLAVTAMNLVYLFQLIRSEELSENNILSWPGFGNQLMMTLIVLVFTLTLLSRPHSIKGILGNQQNYFDAVTSENYSIFESMEDFCRDKGLSDRESEVLGILIGGKTYRMISSDLFISLDTVKTHIRSIYRKTSSEGREDLIRKLRNYALARGSHSD